MSDVDSSFRGFWRRLNRLGRSTIVLILLLIPTVIIPWGPVQFLHSRDHTVLRYVASVILLMLDVPLAWTAWKRLKGDAGRRGLVVVFLISAAVSVLGFQADLKSDRPYFPGLGLLLLWTLMFLALGPGMNRPVARAAGDALASNPPEP